MPAASRLRELAEKKGADNPLWLIIYADLITNLMIFFLMMYIGRLVASEWMLAM